MVLSTAVSLLLHLLVFISLALWLQQQAQVKKFLTQPLEVRLSKPAIVQAPSTDFPQLLTLESPLKIAQPKIVTPVTPVKKTPTTVAEAAQEKSEAIEGIAFPGAVASPFKGQMQASKSFFTARTEQLDGARTLQQQAMETQARQRNEFQAQLMQQQLQQELVKALEAEPLVTGKCVLVESEGTLLNRFKCNDGTLYEVISTKQQAITKLMIALRSMGRTFNGFTAHAQAEGARVVLTTQENP